MQFLVLYVGLAHLVLGLSNHSSWFGNKLGEVSFPDLYSVPYRARSGNETTHMHPVLLLICHELRRIVCSNPSHELSHVDGRPGV